ncbi:MAG: DUF1592 domain-containing protein, partial [Myxococcota bacterium]|nr:DUF1592 domain-containing protein [Myxococcota bacterium]
VSDADCARAALTPIARHTWRRTPTDEEIDVLVTVTTEASEILDDFDAGLRFGIAAILQSPHFVFRSEVGEERDGEHVFTGAELASRISFFLWNSGPDAELLDAAQAGELETEEGLRAHAERLLTSPRTRDGMRNFFTEYLGLQELDHLKKDPTLFDHFDTKLGTDAKEETLRSLEDLAFDHPGDFRDFMTTRTTFVNPRLAALYGIPAPAPEGFHKITMPEESLRRGLLGHASFLNQHAHEVSTSATRRGMAVRTILLCQSIPPPPVDVDPSIPEPSGDLPTLRDRVQEHMENPVCKGCHAMLDPIGLGLENYDGVGRWRDLDNGVLIDASGELDGAEFETPDELGAAVRDHPMFVPCMVQTLVRYARGRTEAPEDDAALEVLTARFAASGHDFMTLVLDVITSPLFRRVGAPVEED